MKRLFIVAGVAAVSLSSPAFAHHVEFQDMPFDTRGACESFSARLSAEDREFLQIFAPQFFSTAGDVESFLAHAWTCEVSPDDGQWYLGNHLGETLQSDWFLRKQSH